MLYSSKSLFEKIKAQVGAEIDLCRFNPAEAGERVASYKQVRSKLEFSGPLAGGFSPLPPVFSEPGPKQAKVLQIL